MQLDNAEYIYVYTTHKFTPSLKDIIMNYPCDLSEFLHGYVFIEIVTRFHNEVEWKCLTPAFNGQRRISHFLDCMGNEALGRSYCAKASVLSC